MGEFINLKGKAGLDNNTDLLKCIILQINDDLLQNKMPDNIQTLKAVAAIYH